ncbi:flagellin N-terminal helical domain-containing protein [Pseudobutyrivibrio sp. MD2005]|uniref:flagellin N-terminal helical domain-containing protein n=1 Tax=Pseudobutyrivibrio sp. MD2005 TaxID=1410616 RepID=UPI0004858B3F|nr:flagellin [Pseudobutyrivibrio sp. MD2005]
MVVQHNMQASNASRMLNITSGNQAKSTEKLSSGYRINRAADDAAGLSISEKMRKQIRGLDQASTNAQDGVSSVQTAEGALTEVHSMLQRMNELAVQAANGTNSESDRSSIQDEIDQLTTEIDRVAETTKFNETYLLKGGNGDKTYHVHAHDAGLVGTLSENTTTATFQMKALSVGDSYTIGGTAYSIGATKVEQALSVLTGGKETEEVTKNDAATKLKDGDTITIDGKSYTIVGSANDADMEQAKITAAKVFSLASAGSTIGFNGKEVTVFSQKDVDVDPNNKSLITATKAYSMVQSELKAASSIGATGTAATVADAGAQKVGDSNNAVTYHNFTITRGSVTTKNDLSFNLHVGSDADMTNKIGVTIETMNSKNLGLDGINVSDDTGKAATYAIDAIADAVAKVSAQRSALGAVQNRLEHTIANVDNVVENTNAAESRIRDTDMADEMVNYSKNNILQQAGQAMLAQANQSTQGVLSILG